MDCDDLRALLHRYVDGELPPALRAEAAAHIEDCPECRRLVQQEQAWHQAIRRAGSYYEAPELVRRRVVEMAGRRTSSPAIARWRGWAMAASLVLAVALSSGVTAWLVEPPLSEPIAEQVVASHVRSLMAEHLTDVASSNEHTVKPWFHGKLDFAPPVEDFAAQGFPLIGGRLDYIAGRSTAALVYRHAQHPINLFIYPAKGSDTAVTAGIDDGYNVLHWRAGGMAFWAVSDVEAKELADFARLVRQKG
jgi:anti-sigma factor (TIGR02949 family)